MNCWKPNSPKTVLCEKLFSEVWDSLQLYADKDCDGKISADEWVSVLYNYYMSNLKNFLIPFIDMLRQ